MPVRLPYAGPMLASLCLALASPAFAAEQKHRSETSGATFGIGIGGGLGSVDDDGCRVGRDCEGTGGMALLSAHVTAFLGPITLGGRFVTDMDREKDASEFAGLIGIRPGRSPVSLMLGPGKIRKANSGAKEKISVLSWELLIAPSGRNGQFVIHGASGEAEFVAFSFVLAMGQQ